MNREEAERLVQDFKDNWLSHWTIYEAKKEALIAALTTEENRPEGPGRYDLTVRVEVETSIFTPLMTATMHTAEGEYSEVDLGETKYITGHWRKVEE